MPNKLCGIGCLLIYATAVGVVYPADRGPLDRKFQDELAAVADTCATLNMDSERQQTLALWIPRDPRRTYLFLPRPELPKFPPGSADPQLRANWEAKLVRVRREYAARLFSLAGEENQNGSASQAYQWLHEVLHHDPAHVEALRVVRPTESPERPRARQPAVAHSQFRWPKGTWWQVESRHFQLQANTDKATALEMIERLERFHRVWQQLFFEYWGSREWLAQALAGNASLPRSEKKHQVVLFRSRDEYVRALSPAEPRIEITQGYFLKANRTSYFFAGDQRAFPVWYHETAHQLFQETSGSTRDVGERWNFWAVEGIAVYLESLQLFEHYGTVGGWDAERLQVVRSRILGGEPPLALHELSQLGRTALQQHADIRKLYSQSAAWVHLALDSGRRDWHDSLVRSISLLYGGLDSPRTFTEQQPFSDANIVDQLRQFLTVTSSDLQYLRPVPDRRQLSLAGAKVDDAALGRLAGSTELTWLDLAYVPVTAQGLANLGKLPKLERLTLVSTPFDDQAAASLSQFPRLQELDLSGSRITDAGLAHVGQVKTLKSLRLTHTQITDRGLSALESLQELEELDLQSTPVTAEGERRLRARLTRLD